MVYQVENFEDAETGTLPGNWSGFTANTGPQEVSEDSPIQGDKSLLFRDEGSNWTGVRHPITDEGVRFAIDINRDTELVDDYRHIIIGPRDSGGDFLYQYRFSDDGSGEFDIEFTDSHTQKQARDTTDYGSIVATTAVGYHNILIDDHSESPALNIDGDVVYDPGTSYTGANDFEWASDDMEVRIDSEVGYSQLIYTSGMQAVVGSNDQTFVHEGPKGQYVSDRGDSEYVFLSGSGLGHE